MSKLLHPGQHPDADQLSAFAENVLPDHERLEALAHLAECRDCGQIVFLAQRAQEVQTPQPHALPGRTGWLRNWHNLWPVAAALTCGLLVFVFVQHRRPIDLPQKSALAVESGAPAPPSYVVQPPKLIVPGPSLTPKPSTAAKVASSRQLASTGPHASVGGIGSVQGNLSINGSLSKDHLSSNPSVFNRNATAAEQQSADAVSAGSPAVGGAFGGPVARAGPSWEQKNGSLAAQRAPTMGAQSQNQLFSQQANVPLRSGEPSQSEIQQSANQTVTVNGAAPVLQTQSAVLSASAFSGKAVQAKSARAPLPSNRPAASTISNGLEILAVDSAGDLFLSKDAGIRWQPVAHQWTGKAIKVSLASPVSKTQPVPNAALSTSFGGVAPAAVAGRVGFELTTDTGATWSSPDGFAWKPQ